MTGAPAEVAEDKPRRNEAAAVRARDFDLKRRQHLAKLADARSAGRVDGDVEPILDALNAHPDLVTTSSCSGRVQLLVLPAPGAKAESRVLGRWHAPPFPIADALAAASDGAAVTLFAEPPILHVLCRDLDVAARLRDAGEAAGFKRSVIRTLTPGTILVEVATTDRLETPVRDNGYKMPPDAVDFLARHARETHERGRERLQRLQHAAIEFK